MKADKIHITHFDFLAIEDLRIDRVVGEHAAATVGGYIPDEKEEDYRWLALEHIWVAITAEEEGGGTKTLMTGLIAGFSFEPRPHATFLTLDLKSGTCLMDAAAHFRSFQDSGMTYLDVLKGINQLYGQADVIAEACMESTPIDFLLQYRETDWAFIKRIASHFGLAVTPAVSREGAFYHVGSASHAAYHLPAATRCSISKHVDTFMEQGANGFESLLEQDFLEYQVTVRDIYDLWDELILGGEGGYIREIHSEYRHGELYHTYTMRPLNGMGVLRTFNGCQSGCSFRGVVREVMQDLVRVELEGDENSGQEITRWFPFSTGYSSPAGPGWYCMPEVGDRVRLQIPGRMEGQGYVISAVHRETSKDRKDPDRKSFKTKYGKELLFTPTTLELTNNQGTSIKIMDGEGIRITSNQDITITSGGNLTLSSEGASLAIAGSGSVDVRQGGAGLHMEDDVTFTGGKFRIQ